MSTRPLIHPGEILREDTLPFFKISVAKAAEAMGITRQTLHRVLREDGPITPDLAVRLGKLVGNGPEIWIRLQAAYDVAKASAELADEIKKIPTVKPPKAA